MGRMIEGRFGGKQNDLGPEEQITDDDGVFLGEIVRLGIRIREKEQDRSMGWSEDHGLYSGIGEEISYLKQRRQELIEQLSPTAKKKLVEEAERSTVEPPVSGTDPIDKPPERPAEVVNMRSHRRRPRTVSRHPRYRPPDPDFPAAG